jgi:hypothetical protein
MPSEQGLLSLFTFRQRNLRLVRRHVRKLNVGRKIFVREDHDVSQYQNIAQLQTTGHG